MISAAHPWHSHSYCWHPGWRLWGVSFHHFQQYLQVQLSEWWAVRTLGEMLQLSLTDSKTLCPISWPATLQNPFEKTPGYKFWFSDLFWPNQNITKSLEFVLPCIPFLPPCLPHCVFFNVFVFFFLPDIMFKLCTHHFPLFLFLGLFYIYSQEIAATNYSSNR